MQLLCELLEVKEQSDHALLESQMAQLMEDLGNIKDLKMGPLVNAFKQTFNLAYGKRAIGNRTSEVGNKFTMYSGIGRDSEIVDYASPIKKWTHVRKAYEANPTAKAFGIYLNGKPVALCVARSDELTRKSDVVGLAWDLTKGGLSDEEQNAVLATVAAPESTDSNDRASRIGGTSSSKGKSGHERVYGQRVYDWDKEKALKDAGIKIKDMKEVQYKAYEDWVDAIKDGNSKATLEKSDTEVVAKMGGDVVGKWDKKAGKGHTLIAQKPFSDISISYGKPTNFQGITQTIAQAKNFIEELAKYGTVMIKMVLVDQKQAEKRNERHGNQPIAREKAHVFVNDLKTRLAKFKVSKIENIEDVKTLVQKVFNGGLSKINFNGQAYKAIPKAQYLGSNSSAARRGEGKSFYDTTMRDLFAGKAVGIEFEGDHVANKNYNDLSLIIKLDKGTIVPVSVTYYDGNKRVTEKV